MKYIIRDKDNEKVRSQQYSTSESTHSEKNNIQNAQCNNEICKTTYEPFNI